MIPREAYEETLLRFFEPIRQFLDDPSVSEVMINGPDQVFIERNGRLHKTDARFDSRESLMAVVRNAAQFVGKQIDESRPILEGRLPDGSRIEALIPPVAPDGPFVSIRRFFQEALTVQRLIESGSLTPDGAAALEAMVVSKLNIVVAGGTGTGKTSMLNALIGFIPEGERVIVIEDSKEVRARREHVLQLEARPADPKGRGAVTVRDLIRATLRMRPDRLVIGEIRGAEAYDFVQAITGGHGGCLATLRATNPRDALGHLQTMCMMGDIDMPLMPMSVQVASGIDVVVQVGQLRDGSRKVTHITEVLGFDIEGGGYLTRDIFERRYGREAPSGQIVSEFFPTGVMPRCVPRLREHGVDFPASVYDAAEKAGTLHP